MRKKRIFAVLLSSTIAFSGMPGNVFAAEDVTLEEEKTDENTANQEEFLIDLKAGLEARWKINDEGGDPASMSSDEAAEYYITLANAEYDTLEKYKDKLFNNKKFSMMVAAYIDAIETQKKAAAYYKDSNVIYNQLWSAGYNVRSLLLPDFVDYYGLDLEDETALQDFRNNKTVLENGNITFSISSVDTGNENMEKGQENNYEELQLQITDLTNENEKLKKENEELKTEVEDLKEDKEANLQNKENNEELTKQLEEKNKENEELNKQLEEKDKEISRLQSELDETKRTTENTEEDKSADNIEANNENEDTDTEESAEKEAAYITANIYAKTGRDFESASKKLKELGNYKDSVELAEKYEKIAKCRFYDDKFYWTPQELADTLKYEFDCRNMTVSTPTVEAGEYGMYYIHFKYDGEDVLITLIDVNEDEGYFENIVFAAYSNSSYFATVFISLYDGDSTMEHSKGITTGLLDEFTAGDDCSITSDGIIYTFSVVNNNFLFGIRSENYKNESTTTTEYTDQNTIQKVQQALNDKGYNCGTADGIAGQKTKDAISAYESAFGITVNGIITDELLQSLGLK